MVIDDDDNNINTQENSKTQFPTVPEEAIVKPEDERPVRMIKRSEEELSGEEDESDIDEAVDSTLDMDGDGSPDWDPSVGPGV